MIRYGQLPPGHELAGRYTVEKLIGKGRSSAVYRALDRRTKSLVAIKVLDPFVAQDPVSVARFEREVRIIRALEHPHIVRLYDFIETEGLELIVMEYLDGPDGARRLEQLGPLTPAELLPVAVALAKAVDACHRRGVLHRDVKPQNILFGENGVKLVDFGVSKISTMSDLTKTGTIVGSPAYVAPEQFESAVVDARSDIYSLGVVFYELLTNRLPYPGATPASILLGQRKGEMRPLASHRSDLPDWLDAIVTKCLHRDPNARYQSGYELASDLEQGARARAFLERGGEPELCLQCKGEKLRGLPFCYQCGSLGTDLYQPGAHALVLYRCHDVDAVEDRLRKVFGDSLPRNTRQKLSRPPLLLMKNVSRTTAAILENELYGLPCELAVTQALPRTLVLPWRYPLVALAVLLPIWQLAVSPPWFVSNPARVVIGLSALSAFLVSMLYYRDTRPLIDLTAIQSRTTDEDGDFMLRIAKGLRGLTRTNGKSIIGHLVRSSIAIQRKAEAAKVSIDLSRTRSLVLEALEAAKAIESYELYLTARSLNEIQAKQEAVAVKLERQRDVTKMEPLVRAGARLESELARYREAQEAHTRIHTTLISMLATFRRVEDSLLDASDAAGMEDALASVQGELAAERARQNLEDWEREATPPKEASEVLEV